MMEKRLIETEKHGQRLADIDRARGLAMCIVIVGHIFALVNGVKPEMQLGTVIRYFSVFELPVFFVISGYLFHRRHESDFVRFIRKRAKGLLVPYFVFSLLNMLFFVFVEPTEAMQLPDMAVTTFTFYGISVLWFFPTLLIGEILWWILHKKLKTGGGMSAAIVLMAVAGLLHGSVQPAEGSAWTSSLLLIILHKLLIVFLRGIVCLFFVAVGHCLGAAAVLWKQHKAWDIAMWVILIAGLVSAYFVPAVNLRDLVWSRTGLWCFSASMVSVGILFFFQKTQKLPLRILEPIGRNSMLLMCTHLDFKIPIYCMMCAEQLVAMSPRAKNYIYWGTLFLTFVVIEAILAVGWKLIRKKCCSKSSGKRSRN